MRAISARLPSPAMIIACVALVVALGGVSYAATVLPKNSVGTAQLQKKSVTAAKLRAGSVNGAKVKDGTLLAADFKAGQLSPGPQGPKGDTGAAGAPGLSGFQVVLKATAPIAPGASGHANATCPAGKKAIAGGGTTEADTPIIESFPAGDAWVVSVRNDTGAPVVLDAFAVCANVS
jgi:hypothetical protein